MGNIGPSRQRYEVLPIPAFGIEDADLWKLDTRPPINAPHAEPQGASTAGHRAQLEQEDPGRHPTARSPR